MHRWYFPGIHFVPRRAGSLPGGSPTVFRPFLPHALHPWGGECFRPHRLRHYDHCWRIPQVEQIPHHPGGVCCGIPTRPLLLHPPGPVHPHSGGPLRRGKNLQSFYSLANALLLLNVILLHNNLLSNYWITKMFPRQMNLLASLVYCIMWCILRLRFIIINNLVWILPILCSYIINISQFFMVCALVNI